MSFRNSASRASFSQRLFNPWLLWRFVLPAVVVVYFVTGSIIVAAILPSLKSALPTVQSGLWLYRSRGERLMAIADEAKRKRRQRCNRLVLMGFLATACWQCAAAAAVTVLGLVLLASWVGRQPDMSHFIATMLILASGVAATTILGLFVIAGAWRQRIRLWIHPNIYRWCEGDTRQLVNLQQHERRFNYAVFTVATSLVLPPLLLGTIAMIATTANGRAADASLQSVGLAILLLFFVVLPIGSIVVYGYLADRILAKTPSESWPES